ncbi:MAG: hypothetical protein GXO61_01280 [Epsilonproteobacteria bacterium]|nr:hypothetical protein [Campylobacterota bacterium]
MFLTALTLFGKSFGWPVKDHWVTATLGEYRIGHLHAGVDIRGYKGTKVYPVLDGVVDRIGNDYVKIESDGDFFDYVHIVPNPALYPGKRVYANTTPLGVTDSLNHVHFEFNDGAKNPLKYLTPYQDLGRCVVYPFSFFYEGSSKMVTSTYNSLLKLSGKVDILARIRDIQSQGNPDTAPYKIAYKIVNSQGRELVDINNITFDTVKGKKLGWIYEVKKSTNSQFYYWVTNKPNEGSYIDTTQFLDGEYTVIVYADDIDGGAYDIESNKGAERVKVYFYNQNKLPAGVKPFPTFEDVVVNGDEITLLVKNSSTVESDEGRVVISFPNLISKEIVEVFDPKIKILSKGDSYPAGDSYYLEVKNLTLLFLDKEWKAGEVKEIRFKLKEIGEVEFFYRASLHIKNTPFKPYAYILNPTNSKWLDSFHLPAFKKEVKLEAKPFISQIIPSPIIASDLPQDILLKGRNFTQDSIVEWRSEFYPTPHQISSSKVKFLDPTTLKLENIKVTKGSHWWEFRVKVGDTTSNWFRVTVINLEEEEVEVEEDKRYILAKKLAEIGEIPISGYFAKYGKGMFDWIYLSSDGKLLAKLEGLDEEGGIKWTILRGFGVEYIKEAFYKDGKIYLSGLGDGWNGEIKELAKELLEKGSFKINGYFARFGDRMYDWLYLTKDYTILAKLEGLNEDGSFKWEFLKLGKCSYFEEIRVIDDKIVLKEPKRCNKEEVGQ